ncbi:MAG TPA: FHA domain-containing protein [Candidatus Sulfomarinibacteraceae bacterium]|nr:FHA domain-containing protein [Candidatus Sulfomarinibacteraceae bacterium]
MASNVFTLTVRRGPDEGQEFTVAEDNITIGRDPVVDIVLNDPEVSRQHARLTRVDDGYQIQDLGSTNGTFVDGKRLAGDPVALTPGMVITMGSNVTLVYRAAADPMATVVSAETGADAPQSEPVGFPGDEPEVELEDMAEDAPVVEAFETPMPEPVEEVEPEDEDTSLEYPPAEEPEALPPVDDADELPSFDDFGAQATPDERTVLDMEAQPSAFEADYDDFGQEEGDELPSFGQEEDLPSFEDADSEAEPADYKPQPESIDRSPPPPPPPSPPEQQSGRNRNLIIAVVIILLLLCCCCLLGYVAWTYGDLFLNSLQI